MEAEFMKVWSDYVALRSPSLEKLNFYDQRSKFVLVLYARINALCDETLLLVTNHRYASTQILMRSTLESYVELLCLIKDEKFLESIYAAEADSEFKHLSFYSAENTYYRGSKEASQNELDALKSEKSKVINIYERFKKAGCEELYRTVYNMLCRFTHGNITALASKNFENNAIVISRKCSKSDLLFTLSSTINIALSSLIKVLEFFNVHENTQETLLEMNLQINELYKKFA